MTKVCNRSAPHAVLIVNEAEEARPVIHYTMDFRHPCMIMRQTEIE